MGPKIILTNNIRIELMQLHVIKIVGSNQWIILKNFLELKIYSHYLRNTSKIIIEPIVASQITGLDSSSQEEHIMMYNENEIAMFMIIAARERR